MEDQGKRLLLAVAIAFGVMMLWGVLFPAEKPPAAPDAGAVTETSRQADTSAGEKSGTEASDGAVAGGVQEPSGQAAAEPDPGPRGEEQLIDFEFATLSVQFSSYGGAVSSWQLKGDKFLDRDRGGQEELVRVPGEQTRLFRVRYEDSTHDVPAEAEWQVVDRGDREVVFAWQSSALKVTKRFILFPDDYALRLVVETEVLGSDKAEQALVVTTYSYQDPDADTGGGMSQLGREWKSGCYLGEDVETKSAKWLAEKGPKVEAGGVRWGGFVHSYFAVIAAMKGAEGRRLECTAFAVEGQPGAMGLDLVLPRTEMEPGRVAKEEFVAYLGPKYVDRLENVAAVAGFEPNFREAVDLGWLAFIAGPLLWLLKWFQGFVVNWGLAIILLTVVVKLLTLPWTHKSMKSMQAMAKLRPQMEKIKEKYKDDRQRQQVETMNLFRAHKVNPMSGCLPMLLQMPIWFALYRSLTVAAELYQAPFIPGWLDDLTLPDPYYVMPILLTGMMFLQTKLTPSTATGTQQKVLMYGMPLMFGVFSFFFPAGLTLYIFTNTCLTLLHHLYMHKDKRAELKAEKLAAKAKKAAGAGQVIDVDSRDDESEGEDLDEGDDESAQKRLQPASGTGGNAGRGPKGGARKRSGQKKSGKRSGKRKKQTRSQKA